MIRRAASTSTSRNPGERVPRRASRPARAATSRLARAPRWSARDPGVLGRRSTTAMRPARCSVRARGAAPARRAAHSRGERRVAGAPPEARAQARAEVEQRRTVGIGARRRRRGGRARTDRGPGPAARAGAKRPASAGPSVAGERRPEADDAQQQCPRKGQHRHHERDRLDARLCSFPHAATMRRRPVTDLRAGVTSAYQDASGCSARRVAAASSTLARTRSDGRPPGPGALRRLGRLLARDGDLQRLADDGLQLGELLRTARRSARSDVRPPLTRSTSTSRSSTRAMRSASRSRSTRSTAAVSCAALVEDVIEPTPEAALVLAQRTRDGGLDARRQDAPRARWPSAAARRRAARSAPAACAGQDRRARSAETPLPHLADAAQGRLARVPQWIVLRVLGVHCAPLDGAQA